MKRIIDRSGGPTTTEIIETDPRFQLVIEALGWEDVDKDGRFDIVAEIVDGITGLVAEDEDEAAHAAEHARMEAASLRIAALEAVTRLYSSKGAEPGWVVRKAATFERYLRTGEYEVQG